MTPAEMSAELNLTNLRVGRFYDRVHRLYPLVDCFFAPTRRRLIEHINQEPAGKLLEIGVGPGQHLRHYRSHQLTAIDCSSAMVVRCREYFPDLDVRHMDGEKLHFAADTFDYVVACHVLSVTAEPARMLTEVYRVLRPGGRLFVLNHETPITVWRHLDRALAPLSKRLCFRSWFRLRELRGVERFQTTALGLRGMCGLVAAYSLLK